MNGESSNEPVAGGRVGHVESTARPQRGAGGASAGAGRPGDSSSSGFDHGQSLRDRPVREAPGGTGHAPAGPSDRVGTGGRIQSRVPLGGNKGSPRVRGRRTEVGVEAERQAEQEFVDTAYARLDAMRSDANSMMEGVLDLGRGGTFQSRTERDVIVRTSLARLEQLDIGDQALTFGRIDRLRDDAPPAAPGASSAPGNGRTRRRRPDARRPPRPSTSAGWPSTAPTTIPWWWTGGPRSPSRSTAPRDGTPRAWCSAATSPWRADGWSGSRTSGSAPGGAGDRLAGAPSARGSTIRSTGRWAATAGGADRRRPAHRGPGRARWPPSTGPGRAG